MATAATTGTEVPADAHGSSGFPPFDPSGFASQLLWLAITFGLFYYLMAKVVLPRIGGILEVRSDRIAGDLDEAERLKRESDEAIAAYEQALAEARQNAHAIALETREKLSVDMDAKRAASEAELSVKLAEAEERIAGIKAQALEQVGDIATETTQEIVAVLIGGTVDQAEAAAAVRGTIDK